MNKLFAIIQSVNIGIDGYVVEDVAEKIGSLFGEEGRRIGKAIDDVTKNITIKIPTDSKD